MPNVRSEDSARSARAPPPQCRSGTIAATRRQLGAVTKACLTKGPFAGGAQASPNLIVATPDPIACDVTGLAILKHAAAAASVDSPDLAGSPWSQPQIVRALAVGIGIGAPTEYSALGDGVAELDELLSLISA